MKKPKTKITDKDTTSILKDVALGVTLKDACAKTNVSVGEFMNLTRTIPAIKDEYDFARRIAAELLVDEIITIADGRGDPQDKKLKIDTRKWLAEKRNKDTFGNDKQKVDVSVAGNITVELLRQKLEEAKRALNE